MPARARRHLAHRSGLRRATCADHGVLDHVDVVALHGFPLDWNHWPHPRVARPDRRGSRPSPTSPSGSPRSASPASAPRRCRSSACAARAELLLGRAERIHWYSLYDLPRAWPATTRHREAEGSSYYRHFHMGLMREDGRPKRAFATFREVRAGSRHLPVDPLRGSPARRRPSPWLKELGVRHLRTGLSWADSFRPGAPAWFDRQMRALEPFEVTLTYCFTPEHRGVRPHHTSPPAADRRVRRLLRADDPPLRALIESGRLRRLDAPRPAAHRRSEALDGVGQAPPERHARLEAEDLARAVDHGAALPRIVVGELREDQAAPAPGQARAPARPAGAP